MNKVMSCLNLQALFDELFPLCRSLTGVGYEQSLAILQRYIPFKIEEYPCGSQVFDWTVPQYWTLNRATLKDFHLYGRLLINQQQMI